MIKIILGGFALAVVILLLKEFIKGFIEGWKEDDKPEGVEKEALVPNEAHEEITTESLMKDMSDRWDKDIAEAEAELAQHTDVLDDTPVITQEALEEPSEQTEMAVAEDNPDAVILNPEDPGYHDYWMSHERAVLGFLPDYTVIDIETTGFDRFNDKIVEISAVKVRNNGVVDMFDGFNKKSKLSAFLKDNSAITQEDIKNGLLIEDLLQGFKDFIGDDVLVGHNIGFDLTFLRYNFHYYEFGDMTNAFIDTMLIGKHYAHPDWSHHRVDDYIANYPKEVGFDNLSQHTSLHDVLIEQRIYELERDILGDDFAGEITSNMFWAFPKVKVVEEDWEIATRRTAKKMFDAIRVAIDDKDYTYSNQLIEELFEAGVLDHNKLYRRMAMNYKQLGEDNKELSTIIKWQSNMGGNIGKGDTAWIQKQLERIDKANKISV